mgnify:CR=1 FL=1|jgi:crotonobetainyl-CoA:carnitine CoA-transferase CaiB-like acyl-CoA transferase
MAAGTSDKYKVKNGYIQDVTSSYADPKAKMSRRSVAMQNAELRKSEEYVKNKPQSESNYAKDVKESRSSLDAAVNKARSFRNHAKIVDRINPEGKPVTPAEDYSDVDKIDKYKKGGTVKSSASSRADGCAQRGKTKGRFV